MTSTQIIAQFVGAVGIALLLASTLMRRRALLLGLDAAGSIVMGVHWSLLGATAAVAISVVVAVMDLAGTDPRNPRGRAIVWASIPVTVVLLVVFWSGPVDVFAGFGLLALAASRLSMGQVRLRALAMAACTPWMVYGIILMSIPQVAFSAAYFIAMGVSIVRIRRGNWRPRETAADAGILPADGS